MMYKVKYKIKKSVIADYGSEITDTVTKKELCNMLQNPLIFVLECQWKLDKSQ